MSELKTQFRGNATTGDDPVVLNTTEKVVIQAIDIQAYSRLTVYVQNVGGGLAADITHLYIESAPTASGPWVRPANGLGGALVASASTTVTATLTAKYIQVVMKTTTDNTTAKVWVCVGGAS